MRAQWGACSTESLVMVGDRVDPSEDPVVRGFVDGDPDAGEEFARRYDRVMQWEAARWLDTKEERDDVVQVAWAHVLARRSSLDPRRDPRAWLCTFVKHACLDRLRQKRREPRAADLDRIDVAAAPSPVVDAPTDVVDRILRPVPFPAREFARLRWFEGRSTEEVARMFGVSPATVREQLRKARRLLGGDEDEER